MVALGHSLAAAPVHVESELLHLVRVAVARIARHTIFAVFLTLFEGGRGQSHVKNTDFVKAF